MLDTLAILRWPRFLRDELEALAVAQELLQKDAERLGCTRFEPMDKVRATRRHRDWLATRRERR